MVRKWVIILAMTSLSLIISVFWLNEPLSLAGFTEKLIGSSLVVLSLSKRCTRKPLPHRHKKTT
ncbi:hypothetical protein [Vibrio salinus]|uniref:hypothetical protein n=1 Tax=Vibrio salinus TaxID=2899784 RepID=UPI001E5F0154|nr:hypothetical protein [Vibrio salinus]MCE0492696.1 hypothetical protein [Vibrio salinus]